MVPAKPKNCKFTPACFDYGYISALVIDVKIGNWHWSSGLRVYGPPMYYEEAQDFLQTVLLKQFWRKLGAM